MARRTPGRRDLTYATLDGVMPDVDRLLRGHAAAGRWSLGQICNHLSGALIGSTEGFGVLLPWPLRATIGRAVRWQLLRTGRMGEGVPLPEKFAPKPGLDERAEAESLRASLHFFQQRPDPPVVHPFLGRLSRDEWDLFHRIHCAHHLSFVTPEPATVSHP